MRFAPYRFQAFMRAAHFIAHEPKTVLFVTPLLRAREIRMASALRSIGWKVLLIYLETTPFQPEKAFDVAIKARSDKDAHSLAVALAPPICHVFSGAVDDLLLRVCRDKPAPVVIDLNDIFCSALFDYCHERFEPTRECLEKATGLCARDLQANYAERFCGFKLPEHQIFFPEYSDRDGPNAPGAAPKGDPNEVRVVSVGTFTLEKTGMYDSAYLQLARRLADQRIHLHIYPHWFYRKSRSSVFNWDLKRDFSDFFELAAKSPYVHIHKSLPLDKLAAELPQYDFGIIAGGCEALGQKLRLLRPQYMDACYSGRISDYLDARLPVLINREVRFNTWLLKRYGLAVELEGVLEPDFRTKLLAIKRDPARRSAVQRAARELSVERNVQRLGAFYERVIRQGPRTTLRLGARWELAKQLPKLGYTFRKVEARIRSLRAEVRELREENAALRRTLDRQEMRSSDELPMFLPPDFDQRLQRRIGVKWAEELSGLLNWPDIVKRVEQTSGMASLLDMLLWTRRNPSPLTRLSFCWEVLAFKNFNQLLSHGYHVFKRTLALNYFTFLIGRKDPQLTALEEKVGRAACERCEEVAANLPDDPQFAWADQATYRYFVLLLWRYAQQVDVNGYLAALEEPEEGRPVAVPVEGRMATQDLANSMLEYYAMTEVIDFKRYTHVLEIGGGYGRDAYVILKLNPHLHYMLVDVPPALWVAQRYLSAVFPEKKVFTVREFDDYASVRSEMEQCQIVCLLPHQLALLPSQRFDVALNISSFGEMQVEQIKAYFEQLKRLTRGYFYTKQWKVSQNAFDGIEIAETDYPVPERWKKIYSRSCEVQPHFFEALYATSDRQI